MEDFLYGVLNAELQFEGRINESPQLTGVLNNISSGLTIIKYNTRFDFPSVGNTDVIYIDLSDYGGYLWDNSTLTYISLGLTSNDITIISGGNSQTQYLE